MSAELPSNKAESRSRTDVRSPEYYTGLRDALIESSGFKDEYAINDTVRTLCEELSQIQTIDGTLDTRRASIIARLKGIRGNGHREKDERFIELFADGYSTTALREWRKKIRNSLLNLEQSKNSLDVLDTVELDPYINALLAKYEKEKISDLLNPNVPLAPEELKQLSFKIRESIEFRNRKIGELLAYRYASKVPVDEPVETFINNTHGIVKEKKVSWDAGYRELGLRGGMTVLVPPWAIPEAIKEISARMEGTPSLDQKQAQEQALAYYILFELIHPFSDGNGRTGRALFVYLQRRLYKSLSLSERPIHIPVARFESGTLDAQVVESNSLRTLPGSLSLDFGTLLDAVMRDPAIAELGLRNRQSEYVRAGNDLSWVSDLIGKVLLVLDSEDLRQKMEQMLLILKDQTEKDFERNEDWKIVADAMKNELHNRKAGSISTPATRL